MGTLLADEEAVRTFCREYLLPYKKPRLVQLVARRKYSDGQLEVGTLILERFVLSFDKGQTSEDEFVRTIRKFEV